MRISAQNPSVNVYFGGRTVSRNRLLCVRRTSCADSQSSYFFFQINICTQKHTSLSSSLSGCCIVSGKTWQITCKSSCLCRFGYKHRSFHSSCSMESDPVACLDKPFLIALIQAKETQHLHQLVCFRLCAHACVFSSFPHRKKGDVCARRSVFVLA